MFDSSPSRESRDNQEARDRQELERQEAALERIGHAAVEIVDRDFGSGYPHFRGASAGKWRYHNRFHAERVGENAAKMLEALGYDTFEQTKVKKAALAHDLRQGGGRGVDEAASALWYAEQLEQEDIPSETVEEGILSVSGTEPIFDENGNIVGQMASFLEYPTEQARHQAQALASGDMTGMFQPEGTLLSHELMRELRGGADPDMSEMVGIQEFQINLLETYAFPLDTPEERQLAERVLAHDRGKAIRHNERLLAKIQRGDITTFEEVLQEDVRYLEENL